MKWEKLSRACADDIVAWASDQPWGREMAKCNQDKDWHSEGDVWTHTKMVCCELQRLDEWDSLNDQQRTILMFTALLHDAAKPLTSQIDQQTGRITSPKHAVKGEHLARSVLRNLGCDLQTREEIARMVRFHGRPAFLLEKANPAHEVVSLSWLVNNELLFLFATADTRGRTTVEMGRPEENLHFWKMESEENNCFNQPYPFPNAHARFLYYRQKEPDLYYVPHEQYSCTVTMLSGLPGSGKDTWLSKNSHNNPVISLDEIRRELQIDAMANQGEVIQLARERCREYLRENISFAFNATNITRQTRQRWISLFADYDAHIEIVYVEPAFDNILLQNRQREQTVPERVIHKLAEKCEPPTWTEAHRLVLSES